MNEINFKYRYGARGKNLGQNFFKIFNITSSTSFEKFGCQRLSSNKTKNINFLHHPNYHQIDCKTWIFLSSQVKKIKSKVISKNIFKLGLW